MSIDALPPNISKGPYLHTIQLYLHYQNLKNLAHEPHSIRVDIDYPLYLEGLILILSPNAFLIEALSIQAMSLIV